MENNDIELHVFRASDGHLYVLFVYYLAFKFVFDNLKFLLQEKECEKNE